jgi:hypothetical protein
VGNGMQNMGRTEHFNKFASSIFYNHRHFLLSSVVQLAEHVVDSRVFSLRTCGFPPRRNVGEKENRYGALCASSNCGVRAFQPL